MANITWRRKEVIYPKQHFQDASEGENEIIDTTIIEINTKDILNEIDSKSKLKSNPKVIVEIWMINN